MAELNPDEQRIYLHAQVVRDFINSETYKDWVYPTMLEMLVSQQLPDPVSPGWEDGYRKAFAMKSAVESIHSMLQRLANRSDDLRKKMNDETPDFNEA